MVTKTGGKLARCQSEPSACVVVVKRVRHLQANFFLGVAYRHQLRYSEACICLDKALEAAREQNDAIKDEIWREIAACKHAWWEQESQQRADKRDRLQARLLAMMDFWDSHRAEVCRRHCLFYSQFIAVLKQFIVVL